MGIDPRLDLADYTYRQTVEAGGHQHDRFFLAIKRHVGTVWGRFRCRSDSDDSFMDRASSAGADEGPTFFPISKLIYNSFPRLSRCRRGDDDSFS